MKSQLLSDITAEWSKFEIKIIILFITAHRSEIIRYEFKKMYTRFNI